MTMAPSTCSPPGKARRGERRADRGGLRSRSGGSVDDPIDQADMDAETAPKLLRLIDMLEDCDDVQEVYHNGEISDEVAATL